MIAPFWTDLDPTGPRAHGAIRIGLLTDDRRTRRPRIRGSSSTTPASRTSSQRRDDAHRRGLDPARVRRLRRRARERAGGASPTAPRQRGSRRPRRASAAERSTGAPRTATGRAASTSPAAPRRQHRLDRSTRSPPVPGGSVTIGYDASSHVANSRLPRPREPDLGRHRRRDRGDADADDATPTRRSRSRRRAPSSQGGDDPDAHDHASRRVNAIDSIRAPTAPPRSPTRCGPRRSSGPTRAPTPRDARRARSGHLRRGPGTSTVNATTDVTRRAASSFTRTTGTPANTASGGSGPAALTWVDATLGITPATDSGRGCGTTRTFTISVTPVRAPLDAGTYTATASIDERPRRLRRRQHLHLHDQLAVLHGRAHVTPRARRRCTPRRRCPSRASRSQAPPTSSETWVDGNIRSRRRPARAPGPVRRQDHRRARERDDRPGHLHRDRGIDQRTRRSFVGGPTVHLHGGAADLHRDDHVVERRRELLSADVDLQGARRRRSSGRPDERRTRSRRQRQPDADLGLEQRWRRGGGGGAAGVSISLTPRLQTIANGANANFAITVRNTGGGTLFASGWWTTRCRVLQDEQ